MISLWFTNPGEDFNIKKCPEKLVIVTSEMAEFNLKTLINSTLPVVGKTNDTIYLVFAGRRLAFSKEQALKIHGEITGKTKVPPKIFSAPAPCKHDCSKCGKCG